MEMCSDRSEVAKALADMDQEGVTTAPQHKLPAEELLPALEGEEAAAARWQRLRDNVGAAPALLPRRSICSGATWTTWNPAGVAMYLYACSSCLECVGCVAPGLLSLPCLKAP